MAIEAADKVVHGNDLRYIGTQIKANFVAKENGKALSSNDYTTAEKTKLAGIEAGAQVNVKPDWTAAAGTAAEILNKPTIPEGAAASDADPLMDGVKSAGSSNAFARGDHRHPSDTSKANVASPSFTGAVSVKATAAATERLSLNPSQASLNYLTSGENEVALVFPSNVTGDIDITLPNRQGTLALNSDIPAPATANPNMDGTAAVGSSAKYAKEDHVHPTDTTRAPLESPQFTGQVGISDASDGGSLSIVYGEGEESVLIGFDSGNVPYPVCSTSRGSIIFKAPLNSVAELTKSGTVAMTSDITTAISGKADSATTLAGYGITNAYTKTEVDTAIANAMKGGYVVQSSLPTASADTMGKIYLIPISGGAGTNVKEEYITYLDGSTYKWELLGTTQIDLSNYVTEDELVALTAAEVETLLGLSS